MSELKPCPFCGGNAQELRAVGDCGELFSVLCECGCETDYHESDWSALNQWNKRQAEDALTEHLRLKEEECKQLQQDKAELVELLKALSGHTCPDDYCTAEEVEAFLKIDEMLEKHKCD